jgi:hypothetical protein
VSTVGKVPSLQVVLIDDRIERIVEKVYILARDVSQVRPANDLRGAQGLRKVMLPNRNRRHALRIILVPADVVFKGEGIVGAAFGVWEIPSRMPIKVQILLLQRVAARAGARHLRAFQS